MTIWAFLLWAFTSSKAIGDSDRMARQFNQPTIQRADKIWITWPNTHIYTVSIPKQEELA